MEYEELPIVDNPIYAKDPKAPVLHPDRPDGNLLKHIKVRKGDMDDGFAKADLIVEKTYRTPTTEHAFLEPECSIGVPAGYSPVDFGGQIDPDARSGEKTVHKKLTVYTGSQIPLCRPGSDSGMYGSEKRTSPGSRYTDGWRIRRQGGHCRADTCGHACRKNPKAVKMLYTRQESLLVHPKRHATVIRVKTGVTKDGKITAVEAELYGDSGAYASLGEKVMTRATTHASGPYDVPNVKIDCFAMYTNNPPSGPFGDSGLPRVPLPLKAIWTQLQKYWAWIPSNSGVKTPWKWEPQPVPARSCAKVWV